MKSVLILTYYWPPAGGPGVQRWLKFVKYFEKQGWKAFVITVQDGTYSASDPELEKDIPAGITVFKTRSRDPFRFYNLLKGKKDGSVSVALINIDSRKSFVDRLAMYIRSNFFVPDGRKGWVPYAYRQAVDVIREHGIDLLVTTGPPHSTHLAGLRLKKETGIRWIADMRDPWTTVYYNDMLPRTARTKRIDRGYEDSVLNNADAVTVVSPGMQQEFSSRSDNVHVVMNGFDFDDMKDEGNAVLPDGRFRLTYTGNFKPNQHVPQIWDAICELSGQNPEFREAFRLCFVGNVDASVIEYFRAKGLEDKLELTGYVSHADAVGMMKSSDLLLFVVPQSRNNRLIITGKLFEYLASATPILSVGPADGDAAAILAASGRDRMMDYAAGDMFMQKLSDYYAQWKSGGQRLVKLDTGMLEKYSRRASALKMTEIMEETVK